MRLDSFTLKDRYALTLGVSAPRGQISGTSTTPLRNRSNTISGAYNWAKAASYGKPQDLKEILQPHSAHLLSGLEQTGDLTKDEKRVVEKDVRLIQNNVRAWLLRSQSRQLRESKLKRDLNKQDASREGVVKRGIESFQAVIRNRQARKNRAQEHFGELCSLLAGSMVFQQVHDDRELPVGNMDEEDIDVFGD